MSGDLQQLKTRLAEEKGQLKHIDDELGRYSEALVGLDKRKHNITKARWVVQEVAKETQQELEFRIAGLVTMAQAAIFEDPYNFVVRFVVRRNRTECDLLFERDGNEWYPLKEEASGGGPIDVACLALRCAFMSMEQPRSRPVLIMDQPGSNVSPDLQHKFSGMIKKISEKLGLQVIMISHAVDAVDYADKVFDVVKIGEVSEVREL